MYIKNNRGAALVMVIIIVAVLMIISSVMLMVHLAEGKTAIRHEHKEEAYYVARSGVEALGSVFFEAVNSVEHHDFLDKIEAISVSEVVTLDAHVIHDGTVLLSVKKITEVVGDSAEYVIEGIGEVSGVEEKVFLHLLYEEPTLENLFKDAIYSAENLVITGFSTIENGTVGCGGTVTYTNASDIAQVTFLIDEDNDGIYESYGVGDNDYIEENLINYYIEDPKPSVLEENFPVDGSGPDIVGYPLTIVPAESVGNNDVLDIVDSEEYDLPANQSSYSIVVNNGGTLHFEGVPDTGIDIIVDSIYVKGDMTFSIDDLDSDESNNQVRIYVRKEATFQTSNNVDYIPDRFRIIGIDGCDIYIGGNATFSGYIYAPGGTVTIETKVNNQGDGGFYGAVVANNVTVQGESDIIYVEPISDDWVLEGDIHMYSPLYWSDQQ